MTKFSRPNADSPPWPLVARSACSDPRKTMHRSEHYARVRHPDAYVVWGARIRWADGGRRASGPPPCALRVSDNVVPMAAPFPLICSISMQNPCRCLSLPRRSSTGQRKVGWLAGIHGMCVALMLASDLTSRRPRAICPDLARGT